MSDTVLTTPTVDTPKLSLDTVMEAAKKYWWALVLIVVVLYYLRQKKTKKVVVLDKNDNVVATGSLPSNIPLLNLLTPKL